MTQTDKVSIRVDFEGEDAEYIKRIKTFRGIKKNAVLIRILIKEEYNRLFEKD